MPRRGRKRRLPRESEEYEGEAKKVTGQPQWISAWLSQQHNQAGEKGHGGVKCKKAKTKHGKKQAQRLIDKSPILKETEIRPAKDRMSSTNHRHRVAAEETETRLSQQHNQAGEKGHGGVKCKKAKTKHGKKQAQRLIEKSPILKETEIRPAKDRLSSTKHRHRVAAEETETRLSQKHNQTGEKGHGGVKCKKAKTKHGKKQVQRLIDKSPILKETEISPAKDRMSSTNHRHRVAAEETETRPGRCVNPDHAKKPLKLFCSDCTQPMCTKCYADEHRGHRVHAYQDVIEAKKDEYQASKKVAVPLLRKLRDQEVELLKMKGERELKKTDLEMAVCERFDKEAVHHGTVIKDLCDQIHHHDEEWDEHWAKIGQYERKIEHHRSEMNRIRSEQNEKMREKEIEKKNLEATMNMKEECIRKIGTEFEKNDKMIGDAINGVSSLCMGIKDNVAHGEELIARTLLQPGLHKELTKTQRRLQELAVAAEVDRVTDLKAKLLVFSSATQVGRCDIPDSKYIVSGVTFVTSNRIAVCGHSSRNWAVRLWDVTSDATETVLASDYMIRSIAYLGNNTVVGLSRTSPVLRIIDLITKEVRGIEVNLNEKAMNELWNVAVDDRGYFLITYGEGRNSHLVLVNKDGNILQDIETGYPYRPTFCRRRGMVVLCGNTSDTISCYRLQDDGLTEVLSVSHGVKGFMCSDICSGNMGEIFIVGVMDGDKPREIRLYQLDIDEEKKQVKMRRIELDDADIRSSHHPRCCVIDDKVVIGYDNKLASFRLS